MTLAEVLAVVKMHRSTVWAKVRNGTFPQPRRIVVRDKDDGRLRAGSRLRFLQSDVIDYINSLPVGVAPDPGPRPYRRKATSTQPS